MNFDVIVVGGGPSGLTIASELALGGARVVVLERRTVPVGSRAGGIHPRVLELLDSRDLAHVFIQRARLIRANALVPTNMWGGMEHVEWRHLTSRFGYRIILPQNVTEELLAEHAQAMGARILRGAVVHSVQEGHDSVTVTARMANGSEYVAKSRYVIGSDGARSGVREQAGIEFEGHDATFTGIVADIPLSYPWSSPRTLASNERGWLDAYPFGDDGDVTRFIIVHADRRHAQRNEPVTAAEVQFCARDILGDLAPEFNDIIWGSRYTDETKIASKFRSGRVLLVGESTRIHYPASGVGMNFCIQDAFNLGWKLAAVIKGYADDSILDTYETERRPVTLQLLNSAAAQCAIQFNFSENGISLKHAFQSRILPLPEVNSQLAHELNGLTTAYSTSLGSHDATGKPVPDAMLHTTEGLSRLGVLLRGQRFLLVDMTGGDCYSNIDFGDLPIRVISAVPAPCPRDLSNVKSLLIRPDGYVSWASTEEPDAARAAREVRSWLKVPGGSR